MRVCAPCWAIWCHLLPLAPPLLLASRAPEWLRRPELLRAAGSIEAAAACKYLPGGASSPATTHQVQGTQQLWATLERETLIYGRNRTNDKHNHVPWPKNLSLLDPLSLLRCSGHSKDSLKLAFENYNKSVNPFFDKSLIKSLCAMSLICCCVMHQRWLWCIPSSWRLLDQAIIRRTYFFLHLARLQRCELVVLDHPILIFELAKIFRQTFPKNHPHHLLLISWCFSFAILS